GALLSSTILSTPPAEAAQSAPIQIAGLLDRVTIRRDERGIPYIQAKNDHDLYLAQGYATAADRLWQMDFLRRTARGQLAEVLSAGPNNVALDQDKQHRTLGLAQVADAEVAQASPESRAVFEASAQGVNAYINSLTDTNLPPEFLLLQYKPSPWKPADSLLIVKLFFEALSSTWRLDIMRDTLAALPPEKQNGLWPEMSSIDVLVVGTDDRRRIQFTVPPSWKSAPRSAAKGSNAGLVDTLVQGQQIETTALAQAG